MQVVIDPDAGFCFGVESSISMAEEHLRQSNKLFCLGELVHNEEEIERLKKLGLIVIDYSQFEALHHETVLIRAHGEPPSTFETARKNKLNLINSTCPIVKKLQSRVFCSYEELIAEDGQVVLFGKEQHPEIVGLKGQTNSRAIVINTPAEVNNIDFTRKIHLFSQTTKDEADYKMIQQIISERIIASGGDPEQLLSITRSVCKQVSNRIPGIKDFAKSHQLILFVAGKSSSNGKVLFHAAQSVNPNTHFISELEEINHEWFIGIDNMGITGATSTPLWLMEKVAAVIRQKH
ncbi:MAG: 4-hydroxy-3-methylbut-2-enyl diphosphate reductase [Bacteroidetes bacterium GWF2_41_31]|nr:MAG: 4-hydroxy-3-methylbut-2-enyl diphosphate reductase [Bacteroidetes bacterium GWF2_41_31]OFZ07721.1 MAG: 4-hydroxy-3-methylbut-2-enyl diphosphate reductase [Bacteroidetes bacterium RIFOXYB12_FULL_41_6]